MKNELQEGDVLFQVNTNETDEITTLTDNTRIVGQVDGGENTDVGWFSLARLKAAIGGGALFECTYGTTTFAAITTALNVGKLPVLIYNNYHYILHISNATTHTFFACGSTSQTIPRLLRVTVSSQNVWSAALEYELQVTSNKVNSLTNQSTNAQYPSAKCVFDALQIKKDTQFAVDQLQNGIWMCKNSQSTLVIEDLSATATIPVGGALSSGELNVEHILVLNNISSGDVSIVLSKNVGVDWMRAEADRFSIKASRTCELRCYITSEEINDKPGLVANIRIFNNRDLY